MYASIIVNGMALRPSVYENISCVYEMHYKYSTLEPINVTCEVKRADMKLLVTGPEDADGRNLEYKETGNKLDL